MSFSSDELPSSQLPDDLSGQGINIRRSTVSLFYYLSKHFNRRLFPYHMHLLAIVPSVYDTSPGQRFRLDSGSPM